MVFPKQNSETTPDQNNREPIKVPKYRFFRIDFPVSSLACGGKGLTALIKFLDTQQAYILKKLKGDIYYRILLRKYNPCFQKDAARFLYRHMTPQSDEKRVLRIKVRPVYDVRTEYPEMLQEDGGIGGEIRFKDRDMIENSLGEVRLPRKTRTPRPSKPKVKKPMSAAEKKRRNQKKNKRKRKKKNRKPEKKRVRKPRDRTKELLKRRTGRPVGRPPGKSSKSCVGCTGSTSPCNQVGGRQAKRFTTAIITTTVAAAPTTTTTTTGVTTRSASRLNNVVSVVVPESEMMFVPRTCSRPEEPLPCDKYHPSYSDSTSSYSASSEEESGSETTNVIPTATLTTTSSSSSTAVAAATTASVTNTTHSAVPVYDYDDLLCYEDFEDFMCYEKTTITDYLSSPLTGSEFGEPTATTTTPSGESNCSPDDLPSFRVPEDAFPNIPDELPVLSHDFVEECLEEEEEAAKENIFPQKRTNIDTYFATWDNVRFWLDYLVGIPDENLLDSYMEACTRNHIIIDSPDHANFIVETIITCRSLQELASQTTSNMQEEQQVYYYKPQIFTSSLMDEADSNFSRNAVLTPL